ncbi:MAG: glycosyltransferase family 4 protein [Planctomycetaceae bacterium]
MRVLILSQYYSPEPVEKVHDLASGLVRNGHEVEVLTGFPCYPHGKIYPGFRQRLISREEMDGVTVRRIPQLPDHSRSVIRRVLYYISFAISAMLIGPFVLRRPDVIVVYQAALPVGIAGWWLSRLRGTRLVLDVVDLWPESVTASGLLNRPWIISTIRRVAKFIYSAASHVNVVTEGFRQNLLKMGVPEEKLSVIENWMPTATYSMAQPDEEFARQFDLVGRFVVMYAGNMGASQDMHTVLDAARRLRSEADIRFVLVGGGTQHDELVARVRNEGLSNVVLPGRYPPEKMPGMYAFASVLLVHLKPDSLSDVSIPSKTFAYMASGRPVLMAVRGDGATFIEKNEFGITAEPSNATSLAAAVVKLRDMPAAVREEFGVNGRRAFDQRYCSQVQINRFERLLEQTVGANRSGVTSYAIRAGQ